MLYIDKERLEGLLAGRGISLNHLAKTCGVSRQSIYNMFDSSPVFNSTFEKVLAYLGVGYTDITVNRSVAGEVLKGAPDRIKSACLRLTDFAKRTHADLLLYSPANIGRFGSNFEWNFAVFFSGRSYLKELRTLRQDLKEEVAPYNISITNLNRSPQWFQDSVNERAIKVV